MTMRHRWTVCLLLVISSWSARVHEDDRHVDRVVFGLEGTTVFLPMPEGNWWVDHWTFPSDSYRKISLLGGATADAGFAVRDFGLADQGREYSVKTATKANQKKITTYYRAVLANEIKVHVGATLYVTPEFSGQIHTITWKYTPHSVTKATDFVEVLHHSTFINRAHVDTTTGKLTVYDWRSCDGGFYTADINGEKFAVNFKVTSFVRVTRGGGLFLDPSFVGDISQFTWCRNDEPVVEFSRTTGRAVYKFPHCLTIDDTCNFDLKTGKLTIKSWQHCYDGVFTMMINGHLQQNGITVVGDVIFVPFGENVQFDPPPFEKNLNWIIWKHGKNLAAAYEADDDVLDYYTICKNDNCILDKTTGILTVKTWDFSHYEPLKVDIDGQTTPYEYVVVKKLDCYEASVKTQPKTTKIKYLICAGDCDGAEPVKYSWRLFGTSDWVHGTKIMETRHILVGRLRYEYDACKIQNPVSEPVVVLIP